MYSGYILLLILYVYSMMCLPRYSLYPIYIVAEILTILPKKSPLEWLKNTRSGPKKITAAPSRLKIKLDTDMMRCSLWIQFIYDLNKTQRRKV